MIPSFNIKIKAGALQFVTFISVLIALLLMAFVLLAHTHRQFKVNSQFTINLVQNASQGIAHALQNDLQTTSGGDYMLSRSNWGAFAKLTSTASIKSKTFSKMALVGGNYPKNARPSLFLKDTDRPLVIVGDTKIEGNVFLPKQGVKPGNISGNSYQHQQLIFGNTRTSGRSLPSIDPTVKSHLKTIIGSGILSSYGMISFNPQEDYENSFKNETKLIYDTNAIYLGNQSFTGNILIKSASAITVSATAKLKDVILIAPIIKIESGTKGYFQAIATKKIDVAKNVTISYPSSLVMIDTDKEAKQNTNPNQAAAKQIVIDANSDIKGLVIYLSENGNTSYQPQIIINKDVVLEGEVYCEKNLELLGTVKGSVYTANFITKQYGSIYQNHVYNGKIMGSDLPFQFSGILFNETPNTVAKWLY